MRTVPAAITAARQASSASLCKVWEMTRLDGTIFRFTEHDRDLVVGGETYYATASFDPSSIKGAADMSVSDMDVVGAFDTELISARDLLGGVFHGASFWVGEVLWDAPEEGVDVQQFGWLGRVREIGGKFVAELRGPAEVLQQTIGEVYQPTCRATLGDARCGISLVPESTTVSSVTTRRVFSTTNVTPVFPVGTWQLGTVTFTSGANAGISMDVYLVEGNTLTLMMPMPFDIAPGDTLDVTVGCDKSLATCRDVFHNVLNFRAEPHVPVSDDLIRGPGPDTQRAGASGSGTGGSGSDVTPDPVPDTGIPTITGTPPISES